MLEIAVSTCPKLYLKSPETLFHKSEAKTGLQWSEAILPELLELQRSPFAPVCTKHNWCAHKTIGESSTETSIAYPVDLGVDADYGMRLGESSTEMSVAYPVDLGPTETVEGRLDRQDSP